jgi:hypothetical protein
MVARIVFFKQELTLLLRKQQGNKVLLGLPTTIQFQAGKH